MNERIKNLDLSKQAKWLLIAGIAVILFTPFLLTMDAFSGRLDFTKTGAIGDTIGGITSPFLNLIASVLVFYALKSQVQANKLVQDQFDEAKLEKAVNAEAENLNQLYKYLNESINAFRFTSLPEAYLANKEDITTDIEYSGGQAFIEMFNQIRCHYHGPQDILEDCQPVSELLSILTIMELLLSKLLACRCDNKEILLTLVKHQFEYKITTNIRRSDIDSLEVYYCSSCECPHGLPDPIRLLVKSIQEKLKSIPQ